MRFRAGVKALLIVLAGTSQLLQASAKAAAVEATKSVCLAGTGTPETVIAACTSTINSDPRAFEAFYFRGVARDQNGDRSGAIMDLNEAIRLNPSYVPALYSKGVVHGELGEFDEAIANYDRVIRLSPDHHLALNNRGVAWKQKGDPDRAIADFSEAFRVNPNYLVALFNRGMTYDDKGDSNWADASPSERADIDHALADYNELIRLAPNSAGVFYRRARILERKAINAPAGEGPTLGDIFRDLDSALRISPDHLNARLYRGWLKTKWGDTDELDQAIADFDYIIARHPGQHRAFEYRADAYSRKGDEDRAQADLDAAQKLKGR